MKHFLLFLMVLLPLTASADAVEIDGIWYNLVSKSKTAEVTRNPNVSIYVGCYSGDIIIPSKIFYEMEEYSVTAIGNNAFSSSSSLTSVNMQEGIISIGNWAFASCTNLEAITLPNSVASIGIDAFSDCSSLNSIGVPSGVTTISMDLFMNCTKLSTVDIPYGVTLISASAFRNCQNLTSIILPNSLLEIETGSFASSGLTSVNIPNNVTIIWGSTFNGCSDLRVITIGTSTNRIYNNSFANCAELTDVYCFAESVPTTTSDAFENSYVDYATLHVPASAISTYSASAPWSGFGNIVPITSEDITIGDLGIGTFCGSNPIDFTGIEDIKAYVVSSYDSGTGLVTLTRTYYVPPFTGVVVKGNKGVHTIPAGVGQPVYPNMMKGVTTNTALAKVNGDYTNYVLANKGGNLGFYAVSDGSTLGAGKAYLPLPTADLPSSSARGLILNFDDEDVTAINSAKIQQSVENGQYYDLQGRRVDNPTSGLYIVNGKKVIIK